MIDDSDAANEKGEDLAEHGMRDDPALSILQPRM